MTATPSIDPARVLSEHLERDEPDLLRALLKTFVEALMGAETDALCGAPYGTNSPDRTRVRNGYRAPEWDTRAGTIDLAIPRLRTGSYVPEWLLERRKRAERALTTVVATCYLLGVSTRRMEKLVETLGITSLSKSRSASWPPSSTSTSSPSAPAPGRRAVHVCRRRRPVMKVHEGGRVVNVPALLACGINADGHREILGLQVTYAPPPPAPANPYADTTHGRDFRRASSEGRRYFGLDVLARSRITPAGTTDDPTAAAKDVSAKPLTAAALTAQSPTTGSRGDRFTHHVRGLDPQRAAIGSTRSPASLPRTTRTCRQYPAPSRRAWVSPRPAGTVRPREIAGVHPAATP